MRFAIFIIALFVLAGCATAYPPAPAKLQNAQSELIQPGDQLRVVIFGEDTLTNVYPVDSQGFIALPLTGTIKVSHMTVADAATAIMQKLQTGYLRDPHVAVSFDKQRDIYVLGEVQRPGNYPYTPGLTVLQAIAKASGYTYRAAKQNIVLQHADSSQPYQANDMTPLQPGDSIMVQERFF